MISGIKQILLIVRQCVYCGKIYAVAKSNAPPRVFYTDMITIFRKELMSCSETNRRAARLKKWLQFFTFRQWLELSDHFNHVRSVPIARKWLCMIWNTVNSW